MFTNATNGKDKTLNLTPEGCLIHAFRITHRYDNPLAVNSAIQQDYSFYCTLVLFFILLLLLLICFRPDCIISEPVH